MKHILRDIKLYKLTGTPLSDEASKLIKFWDGMWTDMKVDINVEKGEIKCWKEGYNYYYFRQDDKNDNLWCDFEKVWSFIQYDLEFTYTETQELLQYMVDRTLNCVINTPHNIHTRDNHVVDKTLNCVINTPEFDFIMIPVGG